MQFQYSNLIFFYIGSINVFSMLSLVQFTVLSRPKHQLTSSFLYPDSGT